MIAIKYNHFASLLPLRLCESKRLGVLTIAFCCLATICNAQRVIALYPKGTPNNKTTTIKDSFALAPTPAIARSIEPSLSIFLPEKTQSTSAAIVICPGGGYRMLVYNAEGTNTAKECQKNGVAAFVLKYRLPNDSFQLDKQIAPLQDAQQAIKMVRDSAAAWGIDPAKVGIMGFSAGGHLASTMATHYQPALIDNTSNTNLRPDFQVLIYPVISMQDSLAHGGSKKALLGANPTKENIDRFSNELQIDEQSPPAWITHAADDKTVDVDNSIFYFEELRRHKVPAELHVYPSGGHGFVLRQPTEQWMALVFRWMKTNKWINN